MRQFCRWKAFIAFIAVFYNGCSLGHPRQSPREFIQPLEHTVFQNKVEAFFQPMTGTALLEFTFWIPLGTATSSSKPGLALLTAQSLAAVFKKGLNQPGLSRLLRESGSSIRVQILETRTQFKFQCLPQICVKIFPHFIHALRHPGFTEVQISLARTQLHSESRKNSQKVDKIAEKILTQIVSDRSKQNVFTFDQLQAIHTNEILDFYEHCLKTGHTYIGIIGALDTDDHLNTTYWKNSVKGMADFWPYVSEESTNFLRQPVPLLIPGVYFVKVDFPTPSVNVQLVRAQKQRVNDKKLAGLHVLASLISDEYSGRLFLVLRSSMALTKEIEIFSGVNDDQPRLFGVRIFPDSRKTLTALNALFEQWKDMQKGFTQEEFAAVKHMLVSRESFQANPVNQLEQRMNLRWFRYPKNRPEHYAHSLRTLDRNDIQRLAASMLDLRNYAWIVTGSADVLPEVQKFASQHQLGEVKKLKAD